MFDAINSFEDWTKIEFDINNKKYVFLTWMFD